MGVWRSGDHRTITGAVLCVCTAKQHGVDVFKKSQDYHRCYDVCTANRHESDVLR